MSALNLHHVARLFGLAALLLSGCSGYSPGSMPPGTSREEVIKSMGPPTGQYPLPDGGSRLEFARGPYGKHTYMLDFDNTGHLKQWQQVLTEANFNAVQMGMTRDQVLMLLGRPSETRYVGWQKLTLWQYRYDAIFCQWFNVGINAQGVVADLGYTPDPMCDHDDRSERVL